MSAREWVELFDRRERERRADFELSERLGAELLAELEGECTGLAA